MQWCLNNDFDSINKKSLQICRLSENLDSHTRVSNETGYRYFAHKEPPEIVTKLGNAIRPKLSLSAYFSLQ